MWERAADSVGIPRFTLMGVLGGLAARGERHTLVWSILGVERPASTWNPDDFYPDALPCLASLRARGIDRGRGGQHPGSSPRMCCASTSTSSARPPWGVEKPAAAFFGREVVAEAGCAPDEVAYVGDRVDNDVLPALAAGLVAVHVRRGPWGFLHDPPPEARRVRSLDELAGALSV